MNKIQNKKSEETWDTIAKSFDKTRRKPWDECIDFINSLKKDCIIADIACGNGRHLIHAAKHCSKAIGIDISNELLKIVKEKIDENNLKNITIFHSDAVNLPLSNSSVDAVLYIAALHNIEGRNSRIKSLKEIKRVLKKDGKALISVWSRWQDKYRKQFFKKWFTKKSNEKFGDIDIYWRQHGLNIPRFYHLYSKKEFIKDLKEAGLEIIKLKDVKMKSKRHPDNYFAVVT